MHSQVTDALKLNINCCTVTSAGILASKSQQGSLSEACIYETLIQAHQNDILQKYIATGTLLVAGYVSTATLDVSAFSDFAVPVVLLIIVNGAEIGSLNEAIYGTVDLFGAAVVTAITNGGSGYTASYSAINQSVTINSPAPGIGSNGFVVSIVINPQFVLDDTVLFDSKSWRQAVHIEDPNGALDEHIAIGAHSPTGVQMVAFIYNKVIVQTVVTWPPTSGAISGTWSVTYRPDDQTVWTGAFINNTATIINSSFGVQASYIWGGSSAWAVYNSVDNKIYSADVFSARIRVVDTANVLQTLVPGISPYIANPQTCIMAVDTTTGNVWTVGVNGIFAFDTTGAPAFADILTPGEQANSITFDNTPGLECMYVGYRVPGKVVKYNLNGTVAVDPFYTDATTVGAVLYSTVHEVIFIKTAAGLYVIRKDGTTKQSLGATFSFFQMMEDTSNASIIGVSQNGTSGQLDYFILGDDGTQQFDGALEGGTPDEYMTEEDQCHDDADMNSMIQHLTADCGCVDCGTATTTSFSPGLATYTLYYGNSASANLNAAGVEALGTLSLSTYATNYIFGATAPSEYKYIAYPALLGTPSRFYDPSTNFDVPMDTVYQVTINSITYNVYRTYYELGGAITITVSS